MVMVDDRWQMMQTTAMLLSERKYRHCGDDGDGDDDAAGRNIGRGVLALGVDKLYKIILL